MEINVLIEEGIDVQAEADWLQKIVEKTLTAENLPPTSKSAWLSPVRRGYRS